MTGIDDKKWALITGASSGIGRALALEFAAGGFNVFLTARDKTALETRQMNAKTGSASGPIYFRPIFHKQIKQML